ncbi:MAG TPA: hypothetical protein VN578_17175 [Candidatus Binatia bacterium]|jgi:hypothetical protein|nr:hypothetical protein [Candidatus Binatia bacterium]
MNPSFSALSTATLLLPRRPRRTFSRLPWCLLAPFRAHPVPFAKLAAPGLLLLVQSAALAIGPAGQTIAPQYDNVVRVLVLDTSLPDGEGFFNGTGSVVANQNVGGQGMLWVLTADHVISTGGPTGAARSGIGFAFGNSPDAGGAATGNSAYYNNSYAQVGSIFRGGSTGVEDLALYGVDYGAYNAALTTVSLVPATAFFNFSDIGYGNQGNLVAGGYQAQGKYGTQRYFNQKVGTFKLTYTTADGYTMETAEFQIQNPTDASAPAGSGAALDADSGSPWFSSANNGTYYKNNEFAVLSGIKGGPTNGLFAFGQTEYAVSLSQQDVNWVYASVPEPGPALALLGLVSTWFALRSRRAA